MVFGFRHKVRVEPRLFFGSLEDSGEIHYRVRNLSLDNYLSSPKEPICKGWGHQPIYLRNLGRKELADLFFQLTGQSNSTISTENVVFQVVDFEVRLNNDNVDYPLLTYCPSDNDVLTFDASEWAFLAGIGPHQVDSLKAMLARKMRAALQGDENRRAYGERVLRPALEAERRKLLVQERSNSNSLRTLDVLLGVSSSRDDGFKPAPIYFIHQEI